MASFPNLWPHRPSDSSEGSRSFGRRLVIAALVLAADAIASALTELATQGNRAVRFMPKHSTGARVAALPAGASVTFERSAFRG
jgi:hypothetical protein